MDYNDSLLQVSSNGSNISDIGANTPGRHNVPENPTSVAMLKFGLPILGIVGLFSNALSLGVMVSKRMRRTSYSVYIAALAVLDTVTLAGLLARQYFHDIVGLPMPGFLRFCNTQLWFISGISTSAAWVVLAMTSERLHAVYRPLEASAVMTPRRARSIVCTLTPLAFLVYTLDLLAFTRQEECLYGGKFLPGVIILPSYTNLWRFCLVATTNSFIPNLVIITMNIALFFKMKRHLRDQSHSSTSANSLGFLYREVGTLVGIVSASYATLTIPYVSLGLYERLTRQRMLHAPAMSPGRALALMLFDTSYCINFFLYVLASPSFRRTLLKKFRAKRVGDVEQ